MLKFLIWIGFMIVVVLSLPGCETPSTIEVEEVGTLTWSFPAPRYLIEVMPERGRAIALWEGNSYTLPIGEYWIGIEPDCDSGTCYYSFTLLVEEGKSYDLTEIVIALQDSL